MRPAAQRKVAETEAAKVPEGKSELVAPAPYQDLDISILLIGDPGAGKTFFAGTCPKPIWIADFDKGSQTLFGERDVTAEIFKDAPYGGRAMERYGIYSFGTAWDAFQNRLNGIGQQIDLGVCPYKTLVVDSFTSLQSCMMAQVLANSKHPKGPIEIQDYGTLLNMQKSFFDQFISWPGLKLMTAHVERAKNELNENIELLPLGLGKFTSLMPQYFDEIYYLEVIKGKKLPDGSYGPPQRILTTQSTNYIKQARSRRRVPTGLPAMFESVRSFLQPVPARAD